MIGLVVIKLELGNCCVVHACACVCVCDKLSTRGSFVIRDSVASLNQSNLPDTWTVVCVCVCVCIKPYSSKSKENYTIDKNLKCIFLFGCLHSHSQRLNCVCVCAHMCVCA